MSRRMVGMSPAEAKFLEGIAYIAERNPSAAEKIVGNMRKLRERLVDFPDSGVRGKRTRPLPTLATMPLASSFSRAARALDPARPLRLAKEGTTGSLRA